MKPAPTKRAKQDEKEWNASVAKQEGERRTMKVDEIEDRLATLQAKEHNQLRKEAMKYVEK